MKIRYGFETNSSSAHSLVITPTTKILNEINELGVFNDGKFIIAGNTEFGWEWEIWDSPADKLFYLLIDAHDEEFTEQMRSLVASKVGVEKENVVFDVLDRERSPFDAYVDHQSEGLTFDVRIKSDEEIWEFIMNPESFIRGGNDNDIGPWRG